MSRPAPSGNSGEGERPCAEHHARRIRKHLADAGGNIRRTVLTVAVDGDAPDGVGTVFKYICKGGFESGALSAVDLMPEQRHAAALLGEIPLLLRNRAVVDDDYVGKARVGKSCDRRPQLFVRIVRGYDDRNIFKFCHSASFLRQRNDSGRNCASTVSVTYFLSLSSVVVFWYALIPWDAASSSVKFSIRYTQLP